jgi:hypothetical protein
MLNVNARALSLSLMTALSLALAGCGETTQPMPIVEVRIAHAAPGVGIANVLLDGASVFMIGAGESFFFPVHPRTRTYEFQVGTHASAVSVPHDADINAVILMDRDDPTAYLYRLERRFGHPRLMVINGDFTTTDPMEVQIQTVEGTFDATLDAGGEVTLEPPSGSYEIRIRRAGADEFLDLQPITLVQDDNAFLILAPLPGPDDQYTRVLF